MDALTHESVLTNVGAQAVPQAGAARQTAAETPGPLYEFHPAGAIFCRPAKLGPGKVRSLAVLDSLGADRPVDRLHANGAITRIIR